MSAKIISGKVLSEEIRQTIRERVTELKEKRGVIPGLSVILIGNDPASEIYVRNKEKGCEEVGILSRPYHLPADVPEEDVISLIRRLNADPEIHGILVQLPLPEGLNEERILAEILPEKDVDGFHMINAGRLMSGAEGVVACTPKGALKMIKSTGMDLAGKEAVVIGRSNIVGKPMAMLLLRESCTVTVCHSRTKDLAEHTKRADILVVAVGKAGFVTGDMIKSGAVVVDVGINRVDGKVVGDVDFESASEVAGWITPVPGGVGKMTITMLLENTLLAAEKQAGLL